MCLDERNTERRGRPPAVRRTCKRTFSVRRLVRLATVAIPRSLLLLAFLAEDVFACVFHALALIRLRFAKRADLGRYMPYFLSVDPADHDFGRTRSGNGNALRYWINDVVTVAELDLQVLSLHGCAVVDAADLKPALEPFRYAGHYVRQQRTIGSPHSPRAFGLVAGVDAYLVALELRRHVSIQRQDERALWALHLHSLACGAGSHARGDRNRFLSDTRHGSILFCYSLVPALRTPCRGSLRPHSCRGRRDRP